MIVINGEHNYTKVHGVDDLDENTRKQIQHILDCPVSKHGTIRIMPDTHAGKGSVIGFTMKRTSGGPIVPNIIGVDIGCGVSAYNLGNIEVNFQELDNYIRDNIPSGYHVHASQKEALQYAYCVDVTGVVGSFTDVANKVYDEDHGKVDRVIRSIGTLGGGNHFIEIDRDSNGDMWLVVHTGSRNFGLQVASYHQHIAKHRMECYYQDKNPVFKDLEFLAVPEDTTAYLHDMIVAQDYASLNRTAITNSILVGYFDQQRGQAITVVDSIQSVHNYYDVVGGIIRKGAISANIGQRVIIPLNMKAGCVIGMGKGNADWNNSAPHGAGRVMGRNQAKRELSMDEYVSSMSGVWSSSVNHSTLDEAPMAYKDPETIIAALDPCVSVTDILQPVYNFKASDR